MRLRLRLGLAARHYCRPIRRADDHVGRALDAWHAASAEPALYPSQRLIDAHHHLWDHRESVDTPPTHRRLPPAPPRPALLLSSPLLLPRYLADDLLADIAASGHRVIATCFVECLTNYTPPLSSPFAPVGEAHFARGAALLRGETRVCAALVAHADLTRAEAPAVLDALGGVAGVRHAHARHPHAPPNHHAPTAAREALLADADFRRGFAALAARRLLFETWGWHTQQRQVVELARAFPEATIVVGHLGGPFLPAAAAAAARRREAEEWARGVEALGACGNVLLKLGGMGMPVLGLQFEARRAAGRASPSSEELAHAWLPFVATAVRAFGTERCMFESNFPIDKVSCSYGNLWNAFKRIAHDSALSIDDAGRDDLFFRTAARAFKIPTAG
ncbi:hypothetical protein AB1Y20_004910 [Prymnesium parvum]|uniref:Amidohydrolase-related domain-containing protein n=1 Tax=Prymnesium parvum TaxID=97485 RepID=A0AB34IY29_PRYPA